MNDSWFSKIGFAIFLLASLFAIGCDSKMAPVPDYSTMSDDGTEVRYFPTQTKDSTLALQESPTFKI